MAINVNSAALSHYTSDWQGALLGLSAYGKRRLDIRVLLKANVLSITESSSANIYVYLFLASYMYSECKKAENKICLNPAPCRA